MGTDGARSTVRKAIGINFSGSTNETEMKIVDYEFEGKPPETVCALLGNPEFAINFPLTTNTLRIATNVMDYEPLLEKHLGLKVKRIVWDSSFKLKNMHVNQMSVGNVFLAGDAAHIHAPLGGRGMNMGIEDVFVFANLLKENRLSEYSKMRLPVVSSFVKQVEGATFLLEKDPSWKKTLYPYVMKVGGYLFRDKIVDFMAGIDHETPFLSPSL